MFNIFGSADSIDTDVMVYLDKIPSIQECKELSVEKEALIFHHTGIIKNLNINFAVVSNGIIDNVFKGTSDECNNSILQTYYLHRQYFHCPVERMVFRDIFHKLARSLRAILSFLSRTQYREIVKKSLKGSAEEKLQVLELIDFDSIKDLGKNNQTLQDFTKQAAFQFAQCLALVDGRKEVYTKADAASIFPNLRPYLYRQDEDMKILSSYKTTFIEAIRKFPLELIHENCKNSCKDS